MTKTEADRAAETRQDAQPVEGLAQMAAGAISPQPTTEEAVNANWTTSPSDATKTNREELGGRRDSDYESPEVSVSASRPPSETMMNTQINAGAPSEVHEGVQHKHQVERDAVISGMAASQSPQHFVPWLSSPAPQIYASPFQMNAGPLPPGFQAYAHVPQPLPSSRHAQSRPTASPHPPGFQAFIPSAPAVHPFSSPSYLQPHFAPHSAPHGRWGYEQDLQSPYYTARGPTGRRKEVYVSQDPFHKWNQPKPKPSRVPYDPYAPAGSINAGMDPVPIIPDRRNTDDSLALPSAGPSWYRPPPSGPKLPYRQATYDSRTSYEPYLSMPYPPVRPQPHTVTVPAQNQRINPAYLSSRQSDDSLHDPRPIPSDPAQGARWDILPSQPGEAAIEIPNTEQVVDAVGPSDHQSPPPRPPRDYPVPNTESPSPSDYHSPILPVSSAILERYSPTSPAYSPTSAPGLPPSLPASSASSSVFSLARLAPPFVNNAASPMAPSQAPRYEDRASLGSIYSYRRDEPSTVPFSDSLPIIPSIPNAPSSMLPPPDPIDVEKQDSLHHSSRPGIRRVFPGYLRSWTRRASRWAMPPRRDRRTSSQSALYAQDEKYETTSVSDEKSGNILSAVIEFTTRRIPTDLYLVFLLFLPSFYFSRVARLFEEAELAMPEIEQMAIRTSLQAQNFLDEQVPDGQDVFPLQWIRLKSTWEHFIDSLLREWKTLNVISALLLSAILTILQIDDAANDYLTRYTALLSFICSLVSLLFGCIYIIRFATMRKTYKAAEWAMEAQESGTSTWWNVFILLALPSIWLTWSILLYIVCIMSYIWRTAANTQESPPPLSDLTVLKIRIGISILLGLALVYACFIIATFRRYGSAMDMKWAARIDHWRLGTMYTPAGPPDRATWGSPHPYAYHGGSVHSSVPRDIYRERGNVEKPPVRFRDNASYIPRFSVPSDTPPNFPLSWSEHYRNAPGNSRERGTGSFDIYQSDFRSQRPYMEAPPAPPSTRTRTLTPLGPRRVDSERLSQKSPTSLPRSLPLHRSLESLRPISLRSIAPTPMVQSIVVPPDNYIPALDADSRIQLPPPHEFMQPVSRSSSPSPARPSSEPSPTFAPRSQDPQSSSQNKSHHRPTSSANSTSNSSTYDKEPFVTSASQSPLQDFRSQMSHLPSEEPPSRRTASMVEDQHNSPAHTHAESSSSYSTTSQPLLAEAPDGRAAKSAYTPKQDTVRTTSSIYSLSHPADKISSSDNHRSSEAKDLRTMD